MPPSAYATTYRTHACGELTADHAGEEVTLAGFVHGKTRDDGFDLRDARGVVRIFLPKGTPPDILAKSDALRCESVLTVKGKVQKRGAADPSLETGAVEVVPESFEPISVAEPLPPEFALGAAGPGEAALEDRLRLRQLDLRRPDMQGRLYFRSNVLLSLRNALAQQGFTEVETPLLSKWTPEATQSFIVPAAGGRAFALPGTPQVYKQLLMAAGIERYFQIARCFRMEQQLTAERQLEFTMLDIEMAYADEEDIFSLVDAVMAHAFEVGVGTPIETPIPRIEYVDAIFRYGSESPDLRVGYELKDLSLLSSRLPDSPVLGALAGACAIVAAGAAAQIPDSEAERLCRAGEEAAPGSKGRWLKVMTGDMAGGLRGMDAHLLAGDPAEALKTELEAQPGDLLLVFTAAATRESAYRAAGVARLKLGRLLEPDAFSGQKHALCIVTRFPFFAYDAAAEGWNPSRHPFSRPVDEDLALIDDDKHRVRARAYDIVLDGVEIGAGSIRNHDLKLQRRIFQMFEYKPEEIQARFAPALEAFKYGLPPHGGLAIGLDRMVALLMGLGAVDEVIAFPKSRKGEDPLLGAPSAISKDVLKAMLGG